MITDSSRPMKAWLRIRKTDKRRSIQVAPNALEQGKCYLIQASSGAQIALYQGVEEDLHAFSVQRYSNGVIRWVDARYLENEFIAFMAFDDQMNPLVDFWYKLGASAGQRLPMEWFAMFEEASRLEQRRLPAQDDDPTPMSHRTPHHQRQQKKKRCPVFFAERKESLIRTSLSERASSLIESVSDKHMSEMDETLKLDPEMDQEPTKALSTTTTEAATAEVAIPEVAIPEAAIPEAATAETQPASQ